MIVTITSMQTTLSCPKVLLPINSTVLESCIQTCIGDVLIWMNSNKLKLDTDKTEVMSVASASFVALVETECANIGGNSVPFKTSVKYLGVHLDRTLSMRQHTDSVCRASFLEL